jgi:hypothetical protein
MAHIMWNVLGGRKDLALNVKYSLDDISAALYHTSTHSYLENSTISSTSANINCMFLKQLYKIIL